LGEGGLEQHMLYVYILESLLEPGRVYVGITEDLKFRLKQHNAGEVFHTSKYKPFRQSLCKEAFLI
jgi:predicted GIY-YIG superfamily endonuclease